MISFLLVADTTNTTRDVLGRLRTDMARKTRPARRRCAGLRLGDRPSLVEWNEDENRWDAVHHPFTAPMPEDAAPSHTDPGAVRAAAYDVVCNGYELSTGSIRIHDRDQQSRVFELMGYTKEEAQARFGHLLDAFE